MAVLRILLAVVMTLGRLLPFLIVGVLLFLVRWRSVRKGAGPKFRGPVYPVEYEEVEDEEE